jgi:nucleotide-binding universal stress UspA family protein
MNAALPDWKSAIESQATRTTTLIKSIVLPLDGSRRGRVALPVAQRLAQLYAATLHATYAGTGPFELSNAASQLGLSEEEAKGIIFESVRSGEGPVEHVSRLMQELPHALLVMSTAVGPQTQANRFGSLTESVFAERPLWAVVVSAEGSERAWNLRHILLAHDGTPVSEPAVGPAADLAQRASAEVMALHVAARGEERPEARGSIAAPLYVDQPQHEWPAWAEEFMHRVVASGAVDSGVHFRLRVAGGQAGSELAHVARALNMDLVVMAWHGHWAEHQDCATRVVVRNAGCPVMLAYSGS